jgi:hypothetical protein
MRALGKRSIASFVKSVLDTAWWVVAISLGLLVILLACSTFLELRGDNLTMSVPVAVQLDTPIHGVGGETTAHFEKLRGDLRFPAKKGAFLSGSVAVVVLMFGYLLWVVTQLRYVFRSLSQGLPFVLANARRIRWVGFAVIFGEFGRPAFCRVCGHEPDHDRRRSRHLGNCGSLSRGRSSARGSIAHHLTYGHTCQAGRRARGTRDYAHGTGRADRTYISKPLRT